jgi:dipeptidyl aminopeptidase/acylaminoacyl peptidase
MAAGPGGRAVLFSANVSQSDWDGANIEVLDLDTGKRKIVQRGGYYGRYLPSGHLVYLRGGTLYGLAFDPERLEPKGAPAILLQDIAASSFGGGQFDFSRNGMFVYLSGPVGRPVRAIVWMDSTGKTQPLLAGAEGYSRPVLSPDGNRLAVIAGPRAGDLFIYDLQREVATKVTFSANVISAIWTPDGKHLVYSTTPGNDSGLMWIRADGAGEPQRLVKAPDNESPLLPCSFSPDGRHLVFLRSTTGRHQDLWILTLDTSDSDRPKLEKSEALLDTPDRESSAEISPNGRWLAYSSNDSGRMEIFVRPFAGGKIAGGGRWQVSAAGGAFPAWSRSGHQLFYLAQDNRIMVADHTVEAGSFRALKPRLWADRQIGMSFSLVGSPFGLGPRPFDVTPDGKRIVTSPPAERKEDATGGLHLRVLVNWFDEVSRRVTPGAR